MKTNAILRTISLTVLLFTSCNKDDSPEMDVPNAKPTVAILTAPVNGKELVSSLPLLQWDASTDPEGEVVSYTVNIGTNESALTMVAETITSLEYQITTSLEKGTTFYWNVTAKDTDGAMVTSETLHFNTEFITNKPIISNTTFPKRNFATVTTFKEKLWLIGGKDKEGNKLADIWSSSDGQNWDIVTLAAPFGKICRHNTLVFDNKLWLFNGSGVGLRNEIWYSENGKDWTMATQITPFYNELGTMFIFENKIWRLAGYQGYTEDLSPERFVWNSSDGIHWTKVSDNHGFKYKYGMAVVPFKGKLIGLEGNQIGSDVFTKVKESSDGIHWTAIAENLPFKFGFYSEGKVLNNKLYMTAGSSYTEFWFTEDGSTWQKAINDRGYSDRYSGSTAVLNNKIYIVGGGNHTSINNDVWVLE